MEIKEAIERIEDHKRIHFAKEYSRAIKITEALDMAIVALQEKEKRYKNPKLTLEDLQQLENRFIWWDNFGGQLCQCKNGYVVTDFGTFSFDYVLSNGSAYLRKPNMSI